MEKIELIRYFMAHAPEKPQDWFKPEMPSPRPEYDHFASTDGFRHFAKEEDARKECKDNYRLVTKDGQPWGHIATLWDIEFEKQKHIQWPLAWAKTQFEKLDAYCKTRGDSAH